MVDMHSQHDIGIGNEVARLQMASDGIVLTSLAGHLAATIRAELTLALTAFLHATVEP